MTSTTRPFPEFDRRRLKLASLTSRVHDLDLRCLLPLSEGAGRPSRDLESIAAAILAARERQSSVILMMGAHVLRDGLALFLIDLMRRGLVTHVGTSGATAIHDFEMALVGATTESVARYIAQGQFGLWEETGGVNDAVNAGAADGLGFGLSLGRWIVERQLPHADVSLFAAGHTLGVPVTVHVGIGHDIVHELPNCDGAAVGLASYRDFLVLARSVEQLEGGVLLNFGTAVMGPETFLKALAMARNVAHQEGRRIDRFASAVFDVRAISGDIRNPPPKSDPDYYFRCWKTNLARVVTGGGTSTYVRGEHRQTLPALYHAVLGLGGLAR
ncbi:MAG: hypothetical protein HY815_17865 [Candidatus Riflebacteria bacterium]|nr:hypothetical protein [Candidatus Riflebacteria bacterium]